MIANICMNPDVLKLMQYVNLAITFAKVIIPLIIIVKSSFDLAKVVSKGDASEFKTAYKKTGISVLAGILIFFVPMIVGTIFSTFVSNINFFACFTDATDENIKTAYIRQAESYLSKAEDTLQSFDIENAKYYISQLEDGTEKDNLTVRLEAVKKTHKDLIAEKKRIESRTTKKVQEDDDTSEPLSVEGAYYSDGKCIANPGVELQSEPDPSCAVNYWQEKGAGITVSFVYPKDSATGLPLGAWPSNYESIPTKISIKKTYMNNILIFPTTPVNGQYQTVYNHWGMDIMAIFGTPVYSPVDGTLHYSLWGTTRNKGSDETAYTVSIHLDTPFTYDGVLVNNIYMTHMAGIRYRCSSVSECNRHISKGELIGFVGNATSTSTDVGWAPHLHITFYNFSTSTSLWTTKMEEIYGLSNGLAIKAGE